MAVYSTLSEGAKQEADIGALGGFVSMMLYRCNADTSSLLDERERLSSVKSLDEVADILEKLKQLSETGEVKKEEQSSPTKTAMDELYKLDLTKEDIQVLEVIGGMERNGRYVGEVLSTPDVTAALQKQGFPNEDIAEHIEMLQVKRFFRDNQEGYARYVRLSAFGFERYLRAFEPKYQGMINDVAVAIVKDGKLEDIAIATHLDIPRPIVMHILDAFDTNDLCSVSRSNMGYQVFDVGVRLQRNVRKMTKVQEPLSG